MAASYVSNQPWGKTKEQLNSKTEKANPSAKEPKENEQTNDLFV